MKVIMVGADRSVHGGVSAVVNNYYNAGLDKKIELKYIGTMVDGSKLRKLFKAMQAYLLFLIYVGGYEIVHINMASDSSYYRKLYFLYVAKLFRKKIVVHQHGGDFTTFYYEQSSVRQRKSICRNLNKADCFVVLTQEWRSFFSQIVSKEKLVVLPNAIEVPEPYEKDYHGMDMLFLGRLCRDKGIQELFTAVAALGEKYPGIHLYMGGIWEDEGLKEKMEQNTGCITWLGWIDRKKKDELLRRCSIYVLPSYYEGMPVSVLEGMAYGCVPVVSQVGGLKNMIEDDTDGIFVKPRDAQSLQAGIERALMSAQYRERLGRQARKKVIQSYEIQNSIKQLVKIYESVLNHG